MFGREPHRHQWLPWAPAGSGRQSLHPDSSKPVFPAPHHGASTSSRPVPYFLSQIELGLSPECPRLYHFVLTYLPGPDALLFLMSICYYPPEAPLQSSARRKPGFPQTAIPSTLFPLCPLPSPLWAPSYLPECERVSLTVWAFPGPGARAVCAPSPANPGVDPCGDSVRILEVGN